MLDFLIKVCCLRQMEKIFRVACRVSSECAGITQSSAYWRLLKMEKRVEAATHPCSTPVRMGNESVSTPLQRTVAVIPSWSSLSTVMNFGGQSPTLLVFSIELLG